MVVDILIYIQNIKEYFIKNKDIESEFIKNENESDSFFERLYTISFKNYEENGTPELTKEEFLLLKNTL